jgi:hypothetical protein
MARKLDPKSKAGFVRSQPASVPAADVVKAAKVKGIKLDVQYVYKVRGSKKNKAKVARLARKTPTAPALAAPSERSGGGGVGNGLVAEIERIVEAKVSALLKARLGTLFG